MHTNKESYTETYTMNSGTIAFYVHFQIVHTNCAHSKPCTYPTHKVYRKSVQDVHKECTSHAPLKGWKIYCTTEWPKCCTTCTRIVHTLHARYVHITWIVMHIICILCAQILVLRAQCVHIALYLLLFLFICCLNFELSFQLFYLPPAMHKPISKVHFFDKACLINAVLDLERIC